MCRLAPLMDSAGNTKSPLVSPQGHYRSWKSKHEYHFSFIHRKLAPSSAFYNATHATLILLLALALTLLPSVTLAGPKTTIRVPKPNGKNLRAQCEYGSNKRWRLRQFKGKSGRNVTPKLRRKAERSCESLVPARSVKNLENTPSLNKVVFSLKKSRAQGLWSRAVSGTPPFLKDIPTQDISSLFWRDGVIDRIISDEATLDDCNEFYGGVADGTSAGVAGCFLTEGVGRALEELLHSSASLCYLRNVPDYVGSSGITVISGLERIPNGNPRKLFHAPLGDDTRTIEVRVKGMQNGQPGENISQLEEDYQQRIFITPTNKSTLKERKSQYGYDIFFCGPTGSTPVGKEMANIRRDGKIELQFVRDEFGEAFQSRVTGYLGTSRRSGAKEVVFNPRLQRTLDLEFKNTTFNDSFKASMVIEPNSEIKMKTYSTNGFEPNRRAYTVVKFLADSTTETRFMEGAFRDEKDGAPGEGFQVALEFRDDRYLAAAENKYLLKLDDVELLTDEFYVEPNPTFDSSEFNCDIEADVVVEMDFSSSSLDPLKALCEVERLENMNYCSTDPKVAQAQVQFNGSCSFQFE